MVLTVALNVYFEKYNNIFKIYSFSIVGDISNFLFCESVLEWEDHCKWTQAKLLPSGNQIYAS